MSSHSWRVGKLSIPFLVVVAAVSCGKAASPGLIDSAPPAVSESADPGPISPVLAQGDWYQCRIVTMGSGTMVMMERLTLKAAGVAEVFAGKGRGCWQEPSAVIWEPCVPITWSADTARYIDTGELYISVVVTELENRAGLSYCWGERPPLALDADRRDQLIGRNVDDNDFWEHSDPAMYRRNVFAKTESRAR